MPTKLSSLFSTVESDVLYAANFQEVRPAQYASLNDSEREKDYASVRSQVFKSWSNRLYFPDSLAFSGLKCTGSRTVCQLYIEVILPIT